MKIKKKIKTTLFVIITDYYNTELGEDAILSKDMTPNPPT